MSFSKSDSEFAPFYATTGSAGADVYTLENYEIAPGATGRVLLAQGDRELMGTDLAIGDGECVMVFPRSSTALRGILVHSGIIDRDYKGKVYAIVTNLTNRTVEINSEERICQLVWMKIRQGPFDVIEYGRIDGFGSTGL